MKGIDVSAKNSIDNFAVPLDPRMVVVVVVVVDLNIHCFVSYAGINTPYRYNYILCKAFLDVLRNNISLYYTRERYFFELNQKMSLVEN